MQDNTLLWIILGLLLVLILTNMFTEKKEGKIALALPKFNMSKGKKAL